MTIFKRIVSAVLLAVFMFWIIPLGAFIGPELEKQACNGKRAICMCSHGPAHQTAKAEGLQFVKNGGVHKERGSSPSFGTDFIIHTEVVAASSLKSTHFCLTSVLVSQSFSRRIEHVPRA